MEEGRVHAQRKAPHPLLFGIVDIDDVGGSEVDIVDVVEEVEGGEQASMDALNIHLLMPWC